METFTGGFYLIPDTACVFGELERSTGVDGSSKNWNCQKADSGDDE